jgi:CHAD domain-containing protein
MKELDICLRADEALGEGLLRVADGLIQDAVQRIRRPTRDHTKDVHFVRVTIKRLRALLRLIRPVIGETAFNRENGRLREAGRRLSLSRDSEVARQTLGRLACSRRRERDAVVSALAGFGGNGEHRVEVTKAMKEIELELEESIRILRAIPFSDGEWKVIEPGLRSVYRACRKRMQRAFRQGDDEAFHKWRIRVKNLFYELQMLRPVWPERLKKMLARLDQLQNEIGIDHDLVVLKRCLRGAPAAFGGAEMVQRVIAPLDEKSRKLRRRLKPLGKAVFDQKSRQFVRELSQHWMNWRKPALKSFLSAPRSDVRF